MENVNIGTAENSGDGEKLRIAFEIVNENFDKLAPNFKELVAVASYDFENVITNSPLEIGSIYYLSVLETGDNFSNIGYVGEPYFRATGQYPISWTNSSLQKVIDNSVIYKNTFENVELFPIEVEGGTVVRVQTEEIFSDLNTFYDLTKGYIDFQYYNNIDIIFQIKKY
jgi:hypothetical protein